MKTHATIPTSRYTHQARADAVSRGLAARTLGTRDATRTEIARTLLEIEGEREEALRFVDSLEGRPYWTPSAWDSLPVVEGSPACDCRQTLDGYCLPGCASLETSCDLGAKLETL